MREPRGSGSSSFRLALKIAARTSIRALGRSTLIAVMVALPVAGLAGIAVVYDSSNPTVEDRLRTELGETEALLRLLTPGASLEQSATNPNYWIGSQAPDNSVTSADLSEFLPEGTRILSQFDTRVIAETATGIATFEAIEGPSWDRAFEGRFDIAEGRTPENVREVMVTASTLPRLGVALDDTVRISSPISTTVTIVGVLDAPIWADSAQYFFGLDGAFSDRSAEDRFGAAFFLPDLELNWDAVQDLNASGITVLSRAVLNDPPPPTNGFPDYDGGMGGILATVAIIAAFATFEVILLAGAAFTVTARQQQRTLATIASVGAQGRLLFRVLTANGIVLGAIGGLIGIAVGVAAAAAFMALTADGSSTLYYGFYVPWLWLAAIAAFAMLIGWIASLLPARNASRFDVVAALRGARKPPAPSKRRPVVGLVMLIVGVAMTVVGGVLLVILLEAGRGISGGHPLFWLPVAMLIAGPILAQLGLVLCGPLLLRAIAKAMRRMGLGARLASRDAARNPSRAVPALSAIMTTVFVAVFAMCMLASSQYSINVNHQYRQAVGQVAVPLSYVDYDESTDTVNIVQYGHAEAIENALRGALDVTEFRILASVPVPQFFGPETEVEYDGEPAPDDFAVPMIPPANQCPASPSSPEFTEEMKDPTSPVAAAAWDDERCRFQSGATGTQIFVGDTSDLALILDRMPSAEAKQSLSNGGAVLLHPQYVHDGEFTIEWWTAEQAENAGTGGMPPNARRTETLEAAVDLTEQPTRFGVFITDATADRLGLEHEDSTILASTKTMPAPAESDALYEAMMNLPENAEGFMYAELERGPQNFAAPWMWGLLGLAGLISIASAAVAIGLARFDGRQDEATLAALGAGRHVRRSFAFWQALIISGVGAVLGAGMGLVPAFALGANPDSPFIVPWLQVGLTMAVLPLLIACGSWMLTTRNKVSARRITIA